MRIKFVKLKVLIIENEQLINHIFPNFSAVSTIETVQEVKLFLIVFTSPH